MTAKDYLKQIQTLRKQMQKIDEELECCIDKQVQADLVIERADMLIKSASMMLSLISLKGFCVLHEHWYLLRPFREISERWNVCYRSVSREHAKALEELSEYLAKQNKPAEASEKTAEGH